MTGKTFRFVLAAILAVGATASLSAQDRPGKSVPLPGGSTADAAALRRLAAQLGTPSATPNLPNLTPEMMDLAMRALQSGRISRDNFPQFQEELRKFSPEQLAQIKQQFDQKFDPKQLDLLQKPPLNPGELQLPPQFKELLPQPNPVGVNPPNAGGNPIDPLQLQPNPLNDFGRQLPRNPSRFGPSLQNNPSAKEAIEFWEKNIGSLNEMPAVRDALITLATSGLDGTGNEKPFWNDLLKEVGDETGSSSSAGSFFKWLNENTGNWSLSTDKIGWSPPAASWSGPSVGGGGFGAPSTEGIGTVGIIVLSIMGLAALALFFWKVLPAIQQSRTPRPIPGLGPWPVDPRSIQTRPQLILAFEYLSVLECGDKARTWNHVTIADGLRNTLPQSAPFADKLARIYALARYSPENEPISEATLTEARGYLCRLAGVSPV